MTEAPAKLEDSLTRSDKAGEDSAAVGPAGLMRGRIPPATEFAGLGTMEV